MNHRKIISLPANGGEGYYLSMHFSLLLKIEVIAEQLQIIIINI